MLIDAVKKALKAFGIDVTTEAKQNLAQSGKGNSKIASEITYSLTDGNDETAVLINMPDYAVFVDKGRKPGRIPPVEAIQGWIIAENIGIPVEAAFGIAVNIGRRGIKPTNFLSKALEKHQPELADRVKEAATPAIKADINEVIP